jgi:hypothetical protein
MAPTARTTVVSDGTAAGALNTHAVAAGDDLLLLVWVALRRTQSNATLSSDLDGALTKVHDIVDDDAGTDGLKRRIVLFALPGPTVGTHTLSVDYDTSEQGYVAASVDFSGANPSWEGLNDNNHGTASSSSIDLGAVEADSLLVDGVSHRATIATGAMSPGADQTEIADDDQSGTNVRLGVSTQSGADGGVMSWTLPASDSFAHLAVEVLAAQAGEAAQDPATWLVQIDKDRDDNWAEAGHDVTDDVRQQPAISIRTGNDVAQGIVQPRVNTCSYELDNQDGTYNDGQGYDEGDPTRVHATHASVTYPLFEGPIRNYAPDGAIPRQVARVDAHDLMGEYVGRTGFSTPLLLGNRIDQCIDSLLDAIGWPAGKRTLDTADRSLTAWWLSSEMDPWRELTALRNTEGPLAQIRVDGEGNFVFEDSNYRTTQTRCTVVQNTYRGHTTEPVYSRILRFDRGTRGVIDKASLPWRTLARAETAAPRIVFSQATTMTASDTSMEIAIPATLEDTDWLFAMAMVEDAGGNSITVPGTPPWTVVGTQFSDGNMYGVMAYASAADVKGTTPVWTPFSADDGILQIVAVRGIPDWEATPYDDQQTGTDTASPADLSASLTVDEADQMLLLFASIDATAAVTIPAGYTQILTTSSTKRMVSYYKISTDDSDENPQATYGTGVNNRVFGFVISPQKATVYTHGEDITLANSASATVVAKIAGALPFASAATPLEDADFEVTDGNAPASVTLSRTSGTEVEVTFTAPASGGPHTYSGRPADNAEGFRLRAIPYVVAASGTVMSGSGDKGLRGYPLRQELAQSDMQGLADDVVTAYGTARPVVAFEVHGDRTTATLTDVLEAEIGDLLRVLDPRTDLDVSGWLETAEWFIERGGRTRAVFTIKEDL